MILIKGIAQSQIGQILERDEKRILNIIPTRLHPFYGRLY